MKNSGKYKFLHIQIITEWSHKTELLNDFQLTFLIVQIKTEPSEEMVQKLG
jgi:hypothetical protein